jgi:alcohol dehydrogenase YqhD (iron-dependent ADH family)
MENFTFQNATKIIFGSETELKVGDEIKGQGSKVLLHYGGGSIKKTGLYDKVTNSLKKAGIEFVELAGAMPNPRLGLVNEGIKICRDNKIDFILAVGGGSAIDSAKAIAVGIPYDGDVWDFYDGKAEAKEAIPVGVVLTIPAAGSEASPNSVVTKEEGLLKRGMYSELIRPVFSILNPELTYTLPDYQTACGASDMMAHILERYFTNTTHVDLTDRLCEGTLK